jgi:hypothetical protein
MDTTHGIRIQLGLFITNAKHQAVKLIQEMVGGLSNPHQTTLLAVARDSIIGNVSLVAQRPCPPQAVVASYGWKSG